MARSPEGLKNPELNTPEYLETKIKKMASYWN